VTFYAWIGLVIGVAYVSLLAGFLLGTGWADWAARARRHERDEKLRDLLADADQESRERES